MHNKVSYISIFSIINAIFYNYLTVESIRTFKIDKLFISDLWYCLMYLNLALIFSIFWKTNIYAKMATITAVIRLLYNTGILFRIVEHTEYRSTYFVPMFTLITVIIFGHKWQQLR